MAAPFGCPDTGETVLVACGDTVDPLEYDFVVNMVVHLVVPAFVGDDTVEVLVDPREDPVMVDGEPVYVGVAVDGVCVVVVALQNQPILIENSWRTQISFV